jgi:hypothetical protein
VKTQSINIDAVIEASYDYRYLLSRGYNYTYALEAVTRRYMLSEIERLLLFRCVHSATYTYETFNKIRCKCFEEPDSTLIIDFYNVLLTIVAMLRNEPLFLCDDCLVRDLRGSKLRSNERGLLEKVFDIITSILNNCCKSVKRIIIVADKNVSHSLDDVQRFVNAIMSRRKDLEVSAILSQKSDATIISLSHEIRGIVVTTDAVIIMNSQWILPLTTITLNYLGMKPLIDFPSLFGFTCPSCTY